MVGPLSVCVFAHLVGGFGGQVPAQTNASAGQKPVPPEIFQTVWKSSKAGKVKRWKARASYPSLAPITPFTSYFNQTVRNYAKDRMAEHAKICSEMGNLKVIEPWELETIYTMGVSSPEFASTWASTYAYSGGAHPNTVYKTFNVGLKAQRPQMLTINDLTGGDSGRISLLQSKLVGELRFRQASSVEADPQYKLTPELLNNFVITPAGATWLFSPYEVASYAEGAFFVKIARKDLAPFVDPKGPFGFLTK